MIFLKRHARLLLGILLALSFALPMLAQAGAIPPENYVDFELFYVEYTQLDGTEKTRTNLDLAGDKKPAPQPVKYEVSLRTDRDIPAGEAQIKVPYALFKERSGADLLPAAIGVPQAPLESPVSPFNYTIVEENGVSYLLFSNTKPVAAGSNSSIQLLYEINDMKTVDGTSWSIHPEVSILGEPLPTTAITGSFDTEAVLKSAVKRAYHQIDKQYYPELYTWNQVLAALNYPALQQPADFDSYKYVLWETRFDVVASQPWNLEITDSPALGGEVVGQVIKTGPLKTFQQGGTLVLNNKELYSLDTAQRVLYTVVRYPLANLTANGQYIEIPNTIRVKVTGVDDHIPQELTSNATHTWEDYEWIYKGDDYYHEKSYPVSIEEGYYSVLKSRATMGEDMSLPNAWRVMSGARGYDMAQSGKYGIVVVDDLHFIKSNVGAYRQMGPEDYYYKDIKFFIVENEIDIYEDAAVPVADGDPVTVSVMTADKPGLWQKVADVPFQEVNTYQIPASYYGRGIYQVQAQHSTDRYSFELRMNMTTVLRASSPILNEFISNQQITECTVMNLMGEYILHPDGTALYAPGNNDGLENLKDDVEAHDQAAYGGYLYREKETVRLTSIQGTNQTQKYVSAVQDSALARVKLTYSLIGSEGYDIYTQGIDFLKERGFDLNRDEVVFYDLLPLGIKMDPSAGTRAGIVNLGVNYQDSRSWQTKDVSLDYEVFDNFRDSGRQLVRFTLAYSGADPTGVYTPRTNVRQWYQAWGVQFGAYYDWEDHGIANGGTNISAFDTVERMVGSAYPDDGTGAPNGTEAYFYDINGDGVSPNHVIYAQAAHNINIAGAAISGIQKRVRADADLFSSPVIDTRVEVGKGYTYTLKVASSQDDLKSIVIFDRLEDAAPGADYWQGTFAGMDLNALKNKGIKPVIYYSSDRGQAVSLAAPGWVEASAWTGELSEVLAVAVDLSKKTDDTDFILKAGEAVSFGIRMTAPDHAAPEKKYAYNEVRFSSEKILSGGGVLPQPDIIGNQTTVELYRRAALSIEKRQVKAPEIYAEDAFTFTVLLDNKPLKDKTYLLFKDGQPVAGIHATDGYGQLKLSRGQKAVFDNLPEGAAYFVRESGYLQWLAQPSGEQAGTLQQGANEAVFDNTFLSLLYVEKKIANAQSYMDADQLFTFTLAFNGAAAAGVDYYLVPPGTSMTALLNVDGLTKQTTGDDGSFALKTGQRAVFAVLEGTQYTVQEINVPEGFLPLQASVAGQMGTGNVLATLTNEYIYKDLFVSKALVASEGITLPDDLAFIFHAKIAGAPQEVQYLLYQSKDDTAPVSGVLTAGADGAFTFSLMAGQQIRLIGLPKGASYEVTEEAHPDFRTTSTGAKGALPSNALSARAEFTNTYLYKNLGVSKALIGGTAADLLQDFTFVISVDGQAYANQAYRLYKDGVEETGSFVTDAEGKFVLKAGQTAAFEKLREGLAYTVKEEPLAGYSQINPNSPDGYSGYIKTSPEHTKVSFTNASGSAGRTLLFNKHFYLEGASTEDVYRIYGTSYCRDPNTGIYSYNEFIFRILVNGQPLVDHPYTVYKADGTILERKTGKEPFDPSVLDQQYYYYNPLPTMEGYFSLNWNDTAIFENLPEGASFSIQEYIPGDTGSYYNDSRSIYLNNSGYGWSWDQVEPANRGPVTGTISSTDLVSASVTNRGKRYWYMQTQKMFNGFDDPNEFWDYWRSLAEAPDEGSITYQMTLRDADGNLYMPEEGIIAWSQGYHFDTGDYVNEIYRADSKGRFVIAYKKNILRYQLTFRLPAGYDIKMEEIAAEPAEFMGSLVGTFALAEGQTQTGGYEYLKPDQDGFLPIGRSDLVSVSIHFLFFNQTIDETLTVSKQVAGGETDQDFGFTLKKSDPFVIGINSSATAYEVSHPTFSPCANTPFVRYDTDTDTPVLPGGALEYTDENGRFTLKHGEKAVFEVQGDGISPFLEQQIEVDARTRYRVTEDSYSDYAATVVYGQNGVLSDPVSGRGAEVYGSDQQVHFTNTREEKSALRVSKLLSHEAGSTPPDAQFTFLLTVNGKSYRNQEYTRYGASGTEILNMVEVNGVPTSRPWTTDNEGYFTLKADEQAVFEWLGAGNTYEILESTPPKGFSQLSPAEGQSIMGTMSQKGEEAVFTNMYRDPSSAASELVVRKSLQVPASLKTFPAETFTFKVTIAGQAYANAPYSLYNETGALVSENNLTGSGGEIQLLGKQYAVLKNLPVDVDYTVEEVLAAGSAYELITSNGAQGATVQGSAEANFVNGLTSLQVGKRVTSDPGLTPPDTQFTFVLTLNGSAAARTPYWLYNLTGEKMGEGSTGENGSFTLKKDQYAVFFGLLKGANYQVAEQPQQNYTQTAPQNNQGFQGGVSFADNKLVFENTYSPLYGLWVSKDVVDANNVIVSDTREFNFLVKVDGQPLLNKDYTVYLNDTQTRVKNTGSTGILQFSAGQRAYLGQIGNKAYTVEEVNVPAVYTPITGSVSGRITNADASVNMVNMIPPAEEMYGDLVITNTVIGGDPDTSFTYHIEADDKGLNGTFGGVTFVDGKATVSLKSGEGVNIVGILKGTKLTVTQEENSLYSTAVNKVAAFTYNCAIEGGKTIAKGTNPRADYVNTRVKTPGSSSPTYPTLHVRLSVFKKLQNGTLKGGEFIFQLKDKQGKVIAKATNAADGTVTFPDRTYSKEVTNWMYTIHEVQGNDPRVIYDSSVYTVYVTSKAVNGQLEATVNVLKDGMPYAGHMTFVNTRKMPSTGDSVYQHIAMLLFVSLLLLTGAQALSSKRREHD